MQPAIAEHTCKQVWAHTCRRDHTEAVKILKADLRIFQTLNNEIYQELTSLLALDDFRRAQICI